MDTVKIRTPDDWHLHLRDGSVMNAVLPHSMRWARRAIIMPNGPMIQTAEEAHHYRDRILEAAYTTDPQNGFEPLMTIYLTSQTNPDDVERGFDEGVISAVKRYPKGATTGSDAGVDDIASTYPVLKRMSARGIPLLCHGERVVDKHGRLIDDYEREAAFMETFGEELVNDYPDLRIVMEHVSKRAGVAFLRKYGPGGRVGGTVTAHHAAKDRRERYRHGGNAADWTCRPFIGHEKDKLALHELIKERPSYLFLGTDSAPHLERKKASSFTCPCGCFSAPNAIGWYAETFEQLGVLDYLETFASVNGPQFYNMSLNESTITLQRKPWRAPGLVPVDGDTIRPVGYRHNKKNDLLISWQQI